MIQPRQLLALIASLCVVSAVAAQDMGLEVPLEQAPGGSLYVDAEAGGVSASFLVDTGAGLVTVSEALFERLRRKGAVREVRRVAARLANNRLQALTVYEVAHFRIGEHCELGPVEVAVMPGAGRNLLGLSALGRAAPFTVSMAPPALLLSGCAGAGAVAAR
ncbi:MAG TPA: retropepsin-like aspartic protease [Pseudohaliea sp.]|nr:retropepsin-like aspartic protease [Pseudohaliea sp.]